MLLSNDTFAQLNITVCVRVSFALRFKCEFYYEISHLKFPDRMVLSFIFIYGN